MTYKELSIEERATIQIGLLHNLSLRSIARLLDRSSSTISREIRRNQLTDGRFEAPKAQADHQARRVDCRPVKKLAQGNELFDLVILMLRQRFSPQQIVGNLKRMELPGYEDSYICRETIYNAIYALPVGELFATRQNDT